MKRKILLADDSPTIQRLVKQTFADVNFEIISVSNGEAAIKKFEEIRPSVVLADIYMPGKNGYEVCEFVKQHPSLSGTPVILLVGAFDAFDDARARTAGAASNITKPFEPTALVELVNSVLSQVTVVEEVAEDETMVIPDEVTAPFTASTPTPPPASAPAPVTMAAAAAGAAPHSDEGDLLGLEALFVEEEPVEAPTKAAITEAEIDRIADRVIRRLTTEVVENIAWEVVPDITEKIVREELKRSGRGG